MENEQTAVVDSSPAQTFDPPQDPAANLEWRKTGEIPAATDKAKPPKEESTPSKNASADKTAETAPASATGSQQEKAKPEHSAAANRLDEILADLKRAGLSPAELKSFKREATAKETPEQTAKPQELTAPVKPQQSDKNADGSPKYDTWEKLEAARDEYFEKLADFKAKEAVAADRQARAAEAQQQTLAAKVAEAKTRYGDQTEATIGEAVRSIINDDAIAPVVKAMLNDSTVLPDIMFVLGSKPEELAAFIDLAKTDPGKAIRKVALLEQLVEQELQKGKALPAADAAESVSNATERNESGQFQKTPAKEKRPAAPPPPDQLNTRGSAPPDPIDAAVRNDDFASFKAEEDRRDLARRRGA